MNEIKLFFYHIFWYNKYIRSILLYLIAFQKRRQV